MCACAKLVDRRAVGGLFNWGDLRIGPWGCLLYTSVLNFRELCRETNPCVSESRVCISFDVKKKIYIDRDKREAQLHYCRWIPK